MAATDFPWLAPADALAECRVAAESADAPAVERSRMAAGAYVERVRPDLFVTLADGVTRAYAPTPDVTAGAMLLTARLYARRSSPVGVVSYAEFGPSSVPRLDPDVERLLGLGRHARPRIG